MLIINQLGGGWENQEKHKKFFVYVAFNVEIK